MNEGQFRFDRQDGESLILVNAEVAGEPATLALDTGATHTVIDLTLLLIAGYRLQDAVDMVEIETGKGVIDAYVFRIPTITCLGQTVQEIEICSYDFLANHVMTAIDGVLGLDFFSGCDLNINFVENTISLVKIA